MRVCHHHDDIPAFICEEEVDAGSPSTSTTRSDTPEKELQECEPFEEAEYDQVDNLLATREHAPRELNFNQITLDEFVTAQLNDKFCSDIHRRLNEGEKKLAFRVNKDVLLVRTVQTDHQIVVPHSLKQPVLYLHHYRV